MPNNLPSVIEKQLLELLANQYTTIEEISLYIQENCLPYHLSPKILGMIFEKYASPVEGYSRKITIDELLRIHPNFRSTNGNQWARSDSSWLGKKYHIVRDHENGSVHSIKLDGFNNDSINKFRGIKSEIVKALRNERCCILDIKSSKGNEIDHKNGKYDSLANIDSSTQKLEDFQVLSKAANDAKRQHCKVCKETGKRYDARRKGYSSAYIVGNEDSKTCVGCYWYDPYHFNEVISKQYKKPDE